MENVQQEEQVDVYGKFPVYHVDLIELMNYKYHYSPLLSDLN